MSLSNYIQALRENRALGVKETSSYGALQSLLDEAGAGLKPPVRCILHPQSQGAGIPDGGLFTREQLQPLGRDFEASAALKMMPARGALEVKGTGADLHGLIDSPQVRKYLDQYRKVICTNYHQFAVVELQSAKPVVLETFGFEQSEAAFWAATQDLHGFASRHGERLRAFLERALLYGAPLASPEAVAAFMASCAREAKFRVAAADVPALDRVRGALEAALSVSFRGGEADAFFRSSLVQTLFYGVFSAWVLWCRENAPGVARFEWRLSAHYLKVPVIQSLFYEVSNPQTLQSLDVVQPLEWVADALNRVDRDEFEKRFSDGSAVQYFYEPFLAAFDPELRKQLGVWYTPAPVVRYMVARVDAVLKTELGLPDGLADERVVVLDPCCGTGAFLVETIHRIDQTLKARGADALGASDLKSAVLGRLFGFELLTAPFVVAHLQLGLVLQSLGAPLGPSERAQIFLTNALTGWQAPDGEQLKIDLPGLLEEKEAADAVKRHSKILVILGNPPYDGYADVAIGEERGLSEAYRTTIDPALPRPEGAGLNELYVRFFRMAERKITESTAEGIVCFISNYSWLEGKSHPGMREAYLSRFSKIWIDNLHGDRKISEYAPDGHTSETVFAVRGSSVGIKVGTAVALLMRNREKHTPCELYYRDIDNARAEARREALVESLSVPDFRQLYQQLQPEIQLGLPFKPASMDVNYGAWPLLPKLFPSSFPGVKTSRDDVVVDVDRERLTARMEAYFSPNISDVEMRHMAPRVMENASRFDATTIRRTLQQRGFLPANIVRYCYRPFDVRWLYWEPDTKLLDEKRTEYWTHYVPANQFLFTTSRTRRLKPEPSFVTPLLSDINLMDSSASCFPLYLRDTTTENLFGSGDAVSKKPNLTAEAAAYLTDLDAEARTLFMHALAIQHAPRYRSENADALRLAWPRVPLPTAKETLEASGVLGEQVAALLDVLRPVAGVTTSTIRSELRVLGNVAKTDGGTLDPAAGELKMNVNWGYRTPQGAIMPGNGRAVERDWTSQERDALEAGAAPLGLDLAGVLSHLGATAFDVHLNDVAYWSGVPARVWSYTMGGYRVLKKWLSYRETAVLGRDLTPAEVREAQAIVRRIAALLLLEPALDANYAACSAVTAAVKPDGVGV